MNTAIQTSTVTVAGPAVPAVTVTANVVVTTTVTACASTSTAYSYTGAFSCGVNKPTAITSGQITCTSPAPAGETNDRLRIEGGNGEGTIFEDCISSGPRLIATPSGGTHQCDGTNDNANPSPGGTATTQLDEAAREAGFPYEGTYSNQFQDFFITSISATTQNSNQFWGLLQDLAFTPVGGCQAEIVPGGSQETLWAFDAFNANTFLSISPEYSVVSSSTRTVQITVSGNDGSGGAPSPYAGATVLGGTVSNANGQVTIAVPTTPGCYQYKATAPGAIRSNAFYLTVLPSP